MPRSKLRAECRSEREIYLSVHSRMPNAYLLTATTSVLCPRPRPLSLPCASPAAMYRGACRRQLALRITPASGNSASAWRAPRHPPTAHRLRYLSTTPIPPLDKHKEPTPQVSDTILPPPPVEEPSSASQTPPQETQHPSSSESSPEHGSNETNADKLALIRAQFKELSHETIGRMRDRGDGFTRQVARTFAQLGSELSTLR